MSIDWEIEELAGYAMGKSEDEVEAMVNDSTVDDALAEKYGVDLDAYLQIVKDLLPFVPVTKTAIGEDNYHAFVVVESDGIGRMIARQMVKLKN